MSFLDVLEKAAKNVYTDLKATTGFGSNPKNLDNVSTIINEFRKYAAAQIDAKATPKKFADWLNSKEAGEGAAVIAGLKEGDVEESKKAALQYMENNEEVKNATSEFYKKSKGWVMENLPLIGAIVAPIIALASGAGSLLTGILAIGGLALATFMSGEGSVLGGLKERIFGKSEKKPDENEEKSAKLQKTGAAPGFEHLQDKLPDVTGLYPVQDVPKDKKDFTPANSPLNKDLVPPVIDRGQSA